MSSQMTPMRAIRLKCLDCCCGSFREVQLCPSEDCSLFPYRFGHRPKSTENTDVTATYSGHPLPEGYDTSGGAGTENTAVSPALFGRNEVL